ncbi:MAG: DUF2142 domain-containing protein [Methanobacterium sp.]|uniref:DUF2142 domain-containing protein n=1 Tax=Methanobacterium sp. TaxID=2164 RepID=UPI003D654EBD|nr:DUF2142 domain-containing protein [Methanobacterium sp.]
MSMMGKFRDIKPQTAFLIIALIYGLGFLVATPAFQVPDEYEHFYRALYVSEGHVLPEKLGDKSGVYVPESVQITSQKVANEWNSFILDRDDKFNITSLLYIPFNSKDRVFEDISRIAVITYPPIPYLISAFAITLGKLFNLSPLILMYLGRLANLLVWIFLTYLAIRITPVQKWVFFMVALIPMTLYEAASLSADSFILGLSFLIVAIFFKYAFEENKKKINIKDIYILFILLLLLALSKQIYFVLLLLIFLIPSEKFGSRKKMFLMAGFLFLSIVIISGAWNLLVKNLYVPIVPQVSISGQIAYILGDPLRFPYILVKTFFYRGLSYQLLFVGNFWLDIPLPLWWLGFYALTIIPVALLDKSKVIVTQKQKLISLATAIIIFLLVCAFVYISWTVVGQTIIDGIQGRYFIPIFPLLFLMLFKIRNFDDIDNKVLNAVRENLNLIIITYAVIFLLITLLIFIISYFT